MSDYDKNTNINKFHCFVHNKLPLECMYGELHIMVIHLYAFCQDWIACNTWNVN